MKLCDLHSDTLYEAWKNGLSPFTSSKLQAPIEALDCENVRVLAVWSDSSLSNEEAYRDFFRILSHYQNEKAKKQITPSIEILAVEDARLLTNDLDRLDTLYQHGVRVLTLTWSGVSCIGGAWDTNEGLTPFGKEVVDKAISLGMAIDLSHASDKTFWDAIDIMKARHAQPMASHSNSRTLCRHNRCISDEMFKTILTLGGIVGISFVPYHLSNDGKASLETMVSHIKHFLSLGGKDTLAIGSDFDGVDALPEGIQSIRDMKSFAERLSNTIGQNLTQRILWQNAHNYLQRNRIITNS